MEWKPWRAVPLQNALRRRRRLLRTAVPRGEKEERNAHLPTPTYLCIVSRKQAGSSDSYNGADQNAGKVKEFLDEIYKSSKYVQSRSRSMQYTIQQNRMSRPRPRHPSPPLLFVAPSQRDWHLFTFPQSREQRRQQKFFVTAAAAAESMDIWLV